MTRTEIASLACRLSAIALIAKGLVTGSTFLGVVIAEHGQGRLYDNLMMSMVGVVGAVTWMVVGYFCWNSAHWLAVRMLDDDPTPVVYIGLTIDELLSLGCAIIGLVTFVPAVRYLLEQFLPIALSNQTFETLWLTEYWRAKLYTGCLELAFSLWLIVGADGFAKFFRWLRTARNSATINKESDSPSAASEESSA